jgi:hypothetical protein
MNYRGALTIVAVLLATLTVLLPACAQAEEFEGGSFRLKLSRGLAKDLKRQEVRLTALKPGKAGKAVVTMPITEGMIEGHYGGGYLFLGGGFKLRAGKRSVTVKQLLLHTADHYLSAKVNGVKVKLASLPEQRSVPGSFEVAMTLDSLAMTPRAASAFNHRLHLSGVFKGGRSLGSASAKVQFSSYSTRGGRIDIALDGAFIAKLKAIEAEPSAPSMALPVEYGAVTRTLSSGFLTSEKAITFKMKDEPHDAEIDFLTTWISFETGLSGAANVNYKNQPPYSHFSAAVARLSAFPPLQLNPETGEAMASGVPLALAPEFAKVLNEAFAAAKGKPDYFVAGEPYGTLGFAVQTR